jgi:hypothetical protein
VAAPATIAGFERGSHTNFEKDQPGDGFAYAYHRDGWLAHVFIYDSGQSNIPDGARSEKVETAFSRSVASLDEVYRSVVPDVAFFLPSDGSQFQCQTFFLTTKKGREARHYICVTGAKGKFFKILISTDPGLDDPQLAGRFVRAWRPILWP